MASERPDPTETDEARVRKPKVDKSGRTSAGILLWRTREGLPEVLLGHPGVRTSPAKTRITGRFSRPRREFEEETGHRPPEGPTLELGEIRQKSGKRVVAWAVEGALDTETAVSNWFEMERPPRSGRLREFPEIDRVAWFGLNEAREMIKAAQAPFLDRLEEAAGSS